MSELDKKISWSIYTLTVAVSCLVFGVLAPSSALPPLGGREWFGIALLIVAITGLVINFVRPRYENTAGPWKAFYDFLLRQLPRPD